MSLSFLIMNLLWTGLVACAADLVTRGSVQARFAQTVWRIAAAIMVLPWAGLLLGNMLPAPVFIIPDLPDLIGLQAPDELATATISGPDSTYPTIANPERLLAAILITGWVCRCVAALISRARLKALVSAARPVTSRIAIAAANHWAEALDLPRPPRLASLPGNRSPFVAGLFDRTLYLPEHLLEREEVRLIIAHECVHITKGDLLTRPLERMIADLLWFSPFAWLARTRLDYWREAACDAETVALCNAPVAYARALTNVARHCRSIHDLPLAAFILNRRKTLPMRISTILTPAKPASRSRVGFAAALALIASPFAIAQGLSAGTAETTQTFRAPIISADGARITSAYGVRKNPFTKENAFHAGTDIAGLPAGTPLAAPAAGEIIFTGEKGNYGQLVDLKLSQSGHVIRYAQLSEIKVRVGQTVQAGTTVGLLGSSGRSTGPHLHIEYMKPNVDANTSDHPIAGVPHDPQSIEGLTLFLQ